MVRRTAMAWVADECSGRLGTFGQARRGAAAAGPNPAHTTITTIVLAIPAPARTDAAVTVNPIAATPRGARRRAHGTSAAAAPTRIAPASTSGSRASQLQTAVAAEPTESSGPTFSASASPPAIG